MDQPFSPLAFRDPAAGLDEQLAAAPSGLEQGQVAQPLVSVILAVRNREACVGRAIESVLAQDYSNFELIVVDDGSTDGTAKAVQAYGDSVRLVRQRPAGPYAARNLGLKHARGALIAFIDSDDAWLPRKLALQVPLMERPEVGLVFGDTIHVSAPDDGASPTGRTSFRISPPSRGYVAERFSWGNFVPTCTVLARRSCLEEIGGFSRSSPISADYLAWFQVALGHELDHVDEPVALYTVHAEGISFDLGRSLAARILLFSAELQRAQDEQARSLVRRLLFNLSLHLGLAILRGRARSVADPARLAWRTAWRSGGFRSAPWAAAFALRQIWLRVRRT
jgi:glycosyltransferase involved in cell wall biosynthesis